MNSSDTSINRNVSAGLKKAVSELGFSSDAIEKASKTSLSKKLVAALMFNKDAEAVDLLSRLSKHLNIPQIDLRDNREIAKTFNKSIASKISQNYALKNCIFPVRLEGNNLLVAMADPLDFEVISEMSFLVDCSIKVAIAAEDEILDAVKHFFDTASDAVKEVNELEVRASGKSESQNLTSEIDERVIELGGAKEPIIKLVNKVLFDAISAGASDLHFEPNEQGVDVRFRVDGVMSTVLSLPKRLQPYIAARIKVVAGMNIAEKRRPQDGRLRVKTPDNINCDVRISSVPTPHGEKLVLRLLIIGAQGITFDFIGLPEAEQKIISDILNSRDKIFVVSGPTGSGKSTTLFASVCHLRTGTTNIITVENPIEYRIDGATQIEVDPKLGITFASGLRSILRQDPDVILVGEVRDLETAEIAFQAAQTGHLVLTTLHTNDAPSTVVRLLDLGLESYVIASSLGGVLAQRLVRKLCTTCSRDLVPEEIEQIKKQYGFEATGFKEASGCVDCDHTGYHGRVGVYSLLTINQKIREIIRKGGNEDDIAAEGRKNGMKDLFVAGMELVKQGVSSLSEVARVIGVTQTSMSTQAMQASAIESKQTSSLDVSGGEIDDELSVAALASTQNQGQIKVLLVDDDEGVRMIMSRRLKKEGFEVVDAFDGQDGIEKLQSFTPDVIICDLMMPRVDGHEFVKHVRANSKIAKLPVIMLTNSDNEQNELMMIEAGANDFVSKTASIKIVVARIKRMLGKA